MGTIEIPRDLHDGLIRDAKKRKTTPEVLLAKILQPYYYNLPKVPVEKKPSKKTTKKSAKRKTRR